MTASELFAALSALYPADGWWPSASPFETAVGAILVQGVSWRNAQRAVERLREERLLAPGALANAPFEKVAQAVRPALYHRQKSGYLQALAAAVVQAGGMDALRTLAPARQRAALLRVRGIGPETAAAIMVYALGGWEPVVDAYALRLLRRTGALPPGAGAQEARSAMRRLIRGDPARAQALHAAIVEHSRRVCKKRPRCGECVVAVRCPRRLGETGAGGSAHGWDAGSAEREGEA